MRRGRAQPVTVSALKHKAESIRSSVCLKLQCCLVSLHCCTENKSILLDVKHQRHRICKYSIKPRVYSLQIQTHTCALLSHLAQITFILSDRLFNITAEVHHALCFLPPCPLYLPCALCSICHAQTLPCWRYLQPSSSVLHPAPAVTPSSATGTFSPPLPRLRPETLLSAALPLGAKRALQRWERLCCLSSALFAKLFIRDTIYEHVYQIVTLNNQVMERVM